MIIFSKRLEAGVTMTVKLRSDKKYTVSFTGGGNTFNFTTSHIELVASRLADLDHHFAMEMMAKMSDAK